MANRTRFAVDTWATLRGISADEQMLVESVEPVDVAVELAPGLWKPLDPPDGVFEELAFIDGVPRKEANVWVLADDGTERAGVCASVAAGAVVVSGGSSEVCSVRVHRGLYTTPGPDTGIITEAGAYELVECLEQHDGFADRINAKMADIEKLVQVPPSVELIVYDGPLRGRRDPRGVGYTKTMTRRYLPEDLHRMLADLDAGQRTPLFLIGGGDDAWTRWSWYMRLPGPRPHRLACLARCEISAVTVKAADAVERASKATTTLVRYASEPFVEERAPQNLYPIAALERELRLYLGDEHLLKMALLASSQTDAATR